MGEISYENKARIETLRKLVLDSKQLLQNFRETVGSFAQRKRSVNGLMSVGQQRNESQVGLAVVRKQHEQREMLNTLSC